MITYRNTKAGDAFPLAVSDHRISESTIVRLAISDDHQYLGRTSSSTIFLMEAPLTEERGQRNPF